MLKKSHKALAISMLPLFMTNFPPFHTNISYIDNLIDKYYTEINTMLNFHNITKSITMLSLFIALFYIGSLIPDLDLKFKNFYKKEDKNKLYLYHRQFTHSILLFLILFISSLSYFPNIIGDLAIGLTAFSLGIFTHLLGDMLTGSVPFFFYGNYHDRFSRIGITTFLPKFMHPLFTKKFPLWIDRHIFFVFIPIYTINLFIFIYFFIKR